MLGNSPVNFYDSESRWTLLLVYIDEYKLPFSCKIIDTIVLLIMIQWQRYANLQ